VSTGKSLRRILGKGHCFVGYQSVKTICGLGKVELRILNVTEVLNYRPQPFKLICPGRPGSEEELRAFAYSSQMECLKFNFNAGKRNHCKWDLINLSSCASKFSHSNSC